MSKEKYVWQYIDAHGHQSDEWEEAVINGDEKWQDYKPEMSKEIEECYQKGDKTYEFSFGQSKFSINLKDICKKCKCLKQTTTTARNNARCGYKRPVRRVLESEKEKKDPFPEKYVPKK